MLDNVGKLHLQRYSGENKVLLTELQITFPGKHRPLSGASAGYMPEHFTSLFQTQTTASEQRKIGFSQHDRLIRLL